MNCKSRAIGKVQNQKYTNGICAKLTDLRKLVHVENESFQDAKFFTMLKSVLSKFNPVKVFYLAIKETI